MGDTFPMPKGVVTKLLGQQGGERIPLKEVWEGITALPEATNKDLITQAFSQLWRAIRSEPLTPFLTTATITLSLFLFALFLFVSGLIASVVKNPASESATLSIFLTEEANSEVIGTKLSSFPGIKSVYFISPKEALERLKGSFGSDAASLEGLEKENPLPASYEVILSQERATIEGVTALRDEILKETGIEEVVFNEAFLKELGRLAGFVTRVGMIALLLMVLVTGFIVFNTIKLALHSHRDEIDIMKLLGATDTHVCAPFLIEGTLQGTIGGVIGTLILSLLISASMSFFSGDSYAAELLPRLELLTSWDIALVILLGAVTGFLGSLFATRGFIASNAVL